MSDARFAHLRSRALGGERFTRASKEQVAGLAIGAAAAWTAAFVGYAFHVSAGAHLDVGAWVAVAVRTLIEVSFGAFATTLFISATARFLVRECNERPALRPSVAGRLPRVGIVCLCSDDADWGALESLTRLTYAGPLHLVIVDDSVNPSSRRAMDEMVRRLGGLRSWRVDVVRRPDRSGGHAAALNYALARADRHFAYVLVCNHRSTVLAPDTLDRALPYLQDPRLAGVQLGTVRVNSRKDASSRSLADVPGALPSLTRATHVGWTPFTGFNALLSTATLKECGGMTPGLDAYGPELTVRANLAGFRIAYAPDIVMGTEDSSTAMAGARRRTHAFESVQLLRMHAHDVLRSSRLSLAEKLTFFQLSTFDSVQTGVLCYLAAALVGMWLRVPGMTVPSPLFMVLTAPLLVVALLDGHWLSATRGVIDGWRAETIDPHRGDTATLTSSSSPAGQGRAKSPVKG